MRREDIPNVLDHFGPYQRRLFLLITCPLMMCGYVIMNVVVTFYLPDHRSCETQNNNLGNECPAAPAVCCQEEVWRQKHKQSCDPTSRLWDKCQVPELPNDTFFIQGENHLKIVNRSVPLEVESGGVERFSQCLLYADRNNVTHNTTGNDVTESCDAWVYDTSEFDNTMATQFDIVCNKKTFRANYNMIYVIGQLVGSPISGLLCDRFGRKRVTVIMYILALILNVAVAFPVITEVLLVYRFLQSIVNTGFYLSIYVLSVELMGPSHRNLSSTLMMVLWLSGCFAVAFISYAVRDWRYIQVLGGVAFAPFVAGFWLVPESPVWLYTKDRVKEANDIVMKIVRYNNIQLPDDLDKPDSEPANGKDSGEGGHKKDDPLLGKSEDKEGGLEKKTDEGQQDAPKQFDNPLALLKYPNLIVRTLIIWFNWAVVAMTYYGLGLNVSNLVGSVRLNFLVSNTVELAGYITAWLLLDRLGRKRLHCCAMLLAGSACLATIFAVHFGGPDLQWATTALAMIGKFGISASFSAIYLMTAELFPTVMRNLGMGCASTVARVGSVVSPYLADLGLYFGGRLAQVLPLVVFGALALVAGLLSLTLPETLNRKLPDTLQEAANFDKKKVYLREEMVDLASATKQEEDDQNGKV